MSGKTSSELTDPGDFPLLTPEPDRRVMIVADIHLGGFTQSQNREIENSFLALLDYCRTYCTELIILGDLFDYWMEYPGSRPALAESVVEKLTRLAGQGFPVLYITGNHDNWMRDFFIKRGIQIEHEYRLVTWDNRRVLLMHGDGLSDEYWNRPRPKLHRLLRNPYFIDMYQKILPEPLGLWLMKWFSKISSIKPSRASRERLDLWCRRVLEQDKTDVVVCGHHHYTRDENYANKRYLNTGNFFSDRSLILYANKDFHPVRWNETDHRIEVSPSLKKAKHESGS